MADSRIPARRRQSDIARTAGVSQATVSMVLNGRTGKGAAISPDTRDRVLRAAAELGYAGNPAARSLAGGRNQLLGVYTFESIFPAESADFYHPFLVGVEREAEVRGYDLVLFTSSTGSDGSRRIFRDNVNRLRMADGCVLLGNDTDRSELDRLAQEDFPFVFIGRREVPGRQIAYVSPDYVAPTVEAVAHLAELGHRKVAHVGSGSSFEPCVDRVDGFLRGRERYGLDSDPRLRLITSAAALRADDVRDLFDAGATAFVTEDDRILRRFLAITDSLGLRAPRDFSVVTQIVPPEGQPGVAVTGLRIPQRELGGMAVGLLVDLLDGDDPDQPRQLTIPCELVYSESTGPPASSHLPWR
ncbi:LacI family DNA-binding transcriptional regulator [Tenggerimyces flavus]|uniref:LacI family DNA-binding transcriptional regulator n=1 Tax=Tenggerimyces flavus TaxID=1708749 RepID=A0ABV7YIZ9_9ACTN|nr:LacI family DNA-binding transcriptional regulator [Tenggerimyces flavus]MBM7787402.1 DNA-binding LacI/PurR family transcriptional regulator [Tenggerimyces flavus]